MNLPSVSSKMLRMVCSVMGAEVDEEVEVEGVEVGMGPALGAEGNEEVEVEEVEVGVGPAPSSSAAMASFSGTAEGWFSRFIFFT